MSEKLWIKFSENETSKEKVLFFEDCFLTSPSLIAVNII